MSWISDLAGKAENLLNKIDQNAANVLQHPQRSDNNKIDNISNYTTGETNVDIVAKRSLSLNSLSISKLSPKRHLKIESKSPQKDDKSSSSTVSSRRSSISIKTDEIEVRNKSASPTIEAADTEVQNDDSSESSALELVIPETSSEKTKQIENVLVAQETPKRSRNGNESIELDHLVETLVEERDDLREQIYTMNQEHENHLRIISDLESSNSKFRQNVLELTEKLSWQNKETKRISDELQDYKVKAKSTLQMKDKLIKELKERGSREDDPSFSNKEISLLKAEIDSLREENKILSEELTNLTSQLESSKDFIHNLEQRLNDKHLEIEELHENVKTIRINEQEVSFQLQSEVRILNQELTTLREELTRQRQAFLKQLSHKEEELVAIKKAYDRASEIPDRDLEIRINTLTQALVKKQNKIEEETTEKNALKVQLERMEEQLRHVRAESRQNYSEIIYINDTDDAKAQVPLLLRENPFDTNVTRRVKRAYSTLDSVGIRIGVFLRRYPLVRIMVFVYVALLHLWVMFVLLSSTPS